MNFNYLIELLRILTHLYLLVPLNNNLPGKDAELTFHQ